jgi:hypothetical protein
MKHFIFIFFILLVGNISRSCHLFAINKYVVTVNQPNLVKNPVIEWVSVDENNKASIAWKKQVNDNIEYYNVYRSTTNEGNNWELAGKVDYKSETYLKDLNSFAQIQSYRYRIAAVDYCGNEVFSNAIIKSIHLSVHDNLLEWNPYDGIEVKSYRVYRGRDPQNLVLIDSVNPSISVYEDFNKLNSDAFYQIEAIGTESVSESDQLFQSRIKVSSNYIKSLSNIVLNTYDSVLSPFENANLRIFPNPLVISSLISFPFDPSQHFFLCIYDLLGNEVYKKNIDMGEFILQRGDLKSGIYILQINGKKIIQQKLMVGGVDL